jgi:hypothetical protein
MHLRSLSHKRRPIHKREALQRIQVYTTPPRQRPTLEESLRTTGMPDPTLLQIVHRECRLRAAATLRAWINEPNLENRTAFLRATEALSVAERALRYKERTLKVEGQLVAFLPEAS